MITNGVMCAHRKVASMLESTVLAADAKSKIMSLAQIVKNIFADAVCTPYPGSA
eukprot:SAG11_NODE_402_length_9751_cov_7.372047_6_plen_54_part_00